MGGLKALFSFQGRTSRLTYWRIQLAIAAAIAVVFVVTVFVAMGAGDIAAVPLLMIVPIFAAAIAVSVRRLHDRDKSAWWLLVYWAGPVLAIFAGQLAMDQSAEPGPAVLAALLVGLALEFWALVEIGFRRGTPSANRFGPPPSGMRRRAPQAA